MVDMCIKHRMNHSIALKLYVLKARLAVAWNVTSNEKRFRKIEIGRTRPLPILRLILSRTARLVTSLN
jgi:hypothetical protein